MRIDDAIPLLQECINQPFGTLFENNCDDLRTNKGKVGQMLLLKIGLQLDSNLMDFDDGELKTNKSDKNGNPLETMFITQISNNIDSLVTDQPTPFEESALYQKISRVVFLPVYKSSDDVKEWLFVDMHEIDLSSDSLLREQLRKDYDHICAELRAKITQSNSGLIHTSSGDFLQVRTKDSKPYHPIFSEHYGRHISDKNFAFYFKKEFMRRVRQPND